MRERRAWGFLILFALVTGGLTWLGWSFIRKLGEPAFREAFGAWVKTLGIRGIGVLFGLQLLQIFAAFIPGGPVELLAGAAYGVLGGTLICLTGSIFASVVIFLGMRRFGGSGCFLGEGRRKFLALFRDAKNIDLVVFILFIIPGMPKDLLTWLAPISGVSFVHFILLSNLARTPAIICTVILGHSFMQGNWVMFIGIFVFTALVGIGGILGKDAILQKI